MAIQTNSCASQTLARHATCLRQGSANSPLFLIGDNHDEHYISLLGQHIDCEIPIYFLPANTENSFPRKTVEGMAMQIVQIVCAIQSKGPYRIAGYSFGGIIAYEVALQLIGADQEVAFVGLLDNIYEPNLAGCKKRYLEELTEGNRHLASMTIKDATLKQQQHDALDQMQLNRVTSDDSILIKEHSDTSPQHSSCNHLEESNTRRAIAHLASYGAANRQYSPQRIPIIVHLFVATHVERPTDCLDWNAILSKAQIRVFSIPTDRNSTMASSSIEALGRALSAAIRDASEDSVSLSEFSYDPLVTLQSGHQTLSPLVCVPGAGATVANFAELLMYCARSVPIYGLEPRGLDSLLIPHSTVQAAAQCYLEAINGIRPSRAIHLLGHSFGGWVVFEMAQRLLDSGCAIASLSILDSEGPHNSGDLVPEYNMTDVLMKYIEVYELILERTLGIERETIEFLSDTAQREVLHHRLIHEGLLPRRSRPDVLSGPLHAFAMALRARYIPKKPYPNQVTLILVDDSRFDESVNREKQEHLIRAWKKWAPNLTYTHAPGNHMTILKPPHVRALVNILGSCGGDSPGIGV